MSEENVEIVRRMYDAIRDHGPAAALDFATSEVELELSPPMPREKFSGRDDVKEFMTEWGAIFGDYRIEFEELIEAGDRVVVLARFRGAGTGGGVPVDIPVAHVWTLRDAQVSHAHFFTDRTEALKAAGLSE